ncbi:MAG: hypothetical protein HYZ16_08255 [Bacteroidetes bacterium]|nr:hypothetical protein [Bacteroidota bacterium]
MKQLKWTLFVVLAWALAGVGVVQGQDTITSEIFPEGGNTFEINICLRKKRDVPFALFDTTKKTFDIALDTMYVNQVDTEVFKFASEADGGKDVPEAEFAYKASFGNGFFKRDGNVLNMIGVSPDDPNLPFVIGFPFKQPLAHFITPLVQGDTYKSSTTSTKNFVVFEIKVQVDAQYRVAGYGTLKVPGGQTYRVMRLWRKYIYTVTQKPLVGEPVISIDSLVTWEFYNNSVKNTILRVDARPSGLDTIWHFDFFNKDLTVGQNSFTYPIPSGCLTFDGSCNMQINNSLVIESGQYFLVLDGQGRILFQETIGLGTSQFNISHLSNGIYIGLIMNKERNVVCRHKFAVRH